jgi:hypothetical protein
MRESLQNYAGGRILSRVKGEVGIMSGSTHDCQLKGCHGVRVSVKWPDGKRTFPCSRDFYYNFTLKAYVFI